MNTDRESMEEVEHEHDDREPSPEEVREKILHILTIYPVISPTMLQGGLGPQIKPALWRPILNSLIDEGAIAKDRTELRTPTGRFNTYTSLRLSTTEAVKVD